VNKKWKTIRVSEEAYDLVKAVADDGGQNIGDVAGALLSDRVAALQESFESLAKEVKRSEDVSELMEVLTSPSSDVALRSSDVASPSSDVALQSEDDDDQDEDNQDGMSVGTKALLGGLVIWALVGLARQKRNPTGSY